MAYAQTLVAANGPLPIKSTFDLESDVEVLFFVSGSGWVSNPGLISIALLVDGNTIGAINCFSNEATSHKTMVPAFFTATIPFSSNGSHTLTLEALGQTITDTNDNFNVTLIY